MPNYVYGNLSVTGTNAEVQKFRKFAEGEREVPDLTNTTTQKQKYMLDMNQFIPYPKKYIKIDTQNMKYYDKLRQVKAKVENQDKLTKAEQKIANELALAELDDGYLPYRTDGYNSGGYDWCCQHWNTKWNFCDAQIDDESNGYIHYNFSTAWSIPMPVLYKMSRMFPKLTFDYSGNEESEEFSVEFTFKGGKITSKFEQNWGEIQAEKIRTGELDDDIFDNDEKLCEELRKHYGHEIYQDKDKNKIRWNQFKCKSCDDKTIWVLK